MPAVKYFTVTQEREVKVSAGDLLEAATIATAIFKGEVPSDSSRQVMSDIHERDLVIREDY